MTKHMILSLCCCMILLNSCSMKHDPLPVLNDPTLALDIRFAPVSLDAFQDLDDKVQAKRATEAEALLDIIHQHERKRYRWIDYEMRQNRGSDVIDITIRKPNRRFDHLVRSLESAVETDPTFALGWLELAKHRDFLGDIDGALYAYKQAEQTAAIDSRIGRPESLQYRCVVLQAWCLRRLGKLDEGLALLENLRSDKGLNSLDAKLIYGLLLGDSGHFRNAYAVSMDIGAVIIPDIHLFSSGSPRMKNSSYVRRWIQAIAWIGIDNPEMARHALGPLNFYRPAFPFKYQYWQDVGLICDLCGDTENARTAYAYAFTSKKHLMPFVNWDAFTTPALVAGSPNIRIPAYSAYKTLHLAGSPFTLGAQLMVECSMTKNDTIRQAKGHTAEKILTACINRGIFPNKALALRGRTRYHLGDMKNAETDLRSACDTFAAGGEDEAGSLLVLASVLYEDGRAAQALPFLDRSIAANPNFAGSWRTLGVVLATLHRDEKALTAMDHAIVLEPGNSRGWHNRGYFHAEHDNLPQAAVDLGVALRIAPGNASTLEQSQHVARLLGESNNSDQVVRAIALSDSLAATIPAVAEGRFEERAGITILGSSNRSDNVVLPIDHAALADSLAAELSPESSPEIRRQLADAYLYLNRFDEVASVLDNGKDSRPESADLVLMLRAERAGGNPALALSAVQEEWDTDDADLWSLVALTCIDHGHQSEGMWALERALVLNPENEGLKTYREFLLRNSTR